MNVRPSVFASQGWYPADKRVCRSTLLEYEDSFPGHPRGHFAGVVPHAGWIFSGRLATWTLCGLKEVNPELVFVFGGHMSPGSKPVCMPEGAWETPLGEILVAEEVTDALVDRFHCRKESYELFEPDNTIEVQMPIIKHLWPKARVVALQVPPDHTATQIGEFSANLVAGESLRAIAIGSTDLTHYGSHYGFCPKGVGAKAHRWSKEENDRPFINHMLNLESSGIGHALANHSACCPGAATAAMAFAKEKGAQRGELVDHVTSCETEPGEARRMWVGYAGIVY
jgi:AmmeMemoRadiSam system protein B